MKKTVKDYLFVGVQFLLLLLFILVPEVGKFHSVELLRILGLLLTLGGFLIVLLSIFQLSDALSPFPSPKNTASLKTTGLYRFARHPIYSGILMACVGWSLYDQALFKILITLLLGILFYFKSKYEEKLLLAIYGQAYEVYKKSTGRFFTFKRFKN